jgi:hypothetical protein
MGGFSQSGLEESSRWRPLVIAILVLVIAGVLAYVFARGNGKTVATRPTAPSYAGNLQIGDLHLSAAENFVGTRVTYLDGKLTNGGAKTLVGAQVEVVFRNTLGEVVDRQTQPMRVETSPLGHRDWVLLSLAPLAPGNNAAFRLTFEHISADWNQGYPQITFLDVEAK